MDDFFRFPHTPHLAWLGPGGPRDDKVLSPAETGALLEGPVVLEEKIDGANLGFSVGPDGQLRVQNRGRYLLPPFRGQFARLPIWLAPHAADLTAALGSGLILFGEWCAARHTVGYDALPDWFLAFDLYDRRTGCFWGSDRRRDWCRALGLTEVPRLGSGSFSQRDLEARLTDQISRVGREPSEGLVVRRDRDGWLQARAKLVRRCFLQAHETHWRDRPLEWNRLAYSGG